MRRMVTVLSIVVALTCAGRALAHEGHEHNVMGTVAAVDANHLDVTTKDGKKVSMLVNKATRYFRGKDPAEAGDVKVGERIVVTVVEEGHKMVAREVRLAGASK